MSSSNINDSSIVSIRNMTFKRGHRVIFDKLNLDVAKGKVTAVLGPSGTGKTTLLRLISGQLKPNSGDIIARGRDLKRLKSKELYEYRKKIGLLFQSGALFNELNVFENVAFPLREHTKLNEQMIYSLVLMKLHAVGLHNAKDLMPQQLSGGMARRVALARTIALDPELIMYDEPFTGQDPISLGVLTKLASTLNSALETSSIIVSHDIEECMEIADYVYVLYAGKVVAKGSPERIRQSDEAVVKQFMHGLPDGPISFHYPGNDYIKQILTGVK